MFRQLTHNLLNVLVQIANKLGLKKFLLGGEVCSPILINSYFAIYSQAKITPT
jgi:hypothetical protein